MNNQEIFDKVSTHLLTQNAQSLSNSDGEGGISSCMYRGDNGMSCAVGCLIPDELYQTKMEYDNINSEVVYNIIMSVGIHKTSISILKDLQQLHDNCEPAAWPAALVLLAARHKVKDDAAKYFKRKDHE